MHTSAHISTVLHQLICTPTSICAYLHIRCVCPHLHTDQHMVLFIHTSACAQSVRVHQHTYAYVQPCTWLYRCVCVHLHTYICTQTSACTAAHRTHTSTHTPTHTPAGSTHIPEHISTSEHKTAHISTHTSAHANTSARTHTSAHTSAHKHLQAHKSTSTDWQLKTEDRSLYM